MDIIYSRKRIKLPRFTKKRRKIIKKILKIAIIILIAILTYTLVLNSVKPVFENICKTEAKKIATKISNENATEIMANYKYDDLVTITRTVDNKITGIEFNMITINQIESEIAVKIQKDMDEYKSENIGIALGTFSGSKILSSRGPKIYYKIISIGNVETSYKSEFKSAGINQTSHKLYLQVNSIVSILTPFNTIEEKIENQVILAENIIVGEIPQTYYNFNGIENPIDTLESIQ